MDSLLKKQNMGQLLLVILFIVYLIMGYRTPEPLSSVLDTMYGKIAIGMVAMILLVSCHPILGVLGVIVAYELVRRSFPNEVDQYIPSEMQKAEHLTAFNQFPYTLEQEMVKKMTPQRNDESIFSSQVTYKPLLENNYDASPV